MTNNITLSDVHLDELINNKYIVIDDFLTAESYQRLKIEATEQDYRDAQITDGLEQDIRSDGIAWIEQDSADNTQPEGDAFINVLQGLAQQFNQNFFVGIQRAEAHFACYGAGKFYKKHVDNPKGSDNRVFSCVFYMNDDWKQENGGELIMYLKKEQKSIWPMANRMVIFDSNLPHEVKPNNRRRYSIACWLRRDS